MFSLTTQAVHFFVAKESRATVLLDGEAKRQRKEGNDVWGPNEVKTRKERWNVKQILSTVSLFDGQQIYKRKVD